MSENTTARNKAPRTRPGGGGPMGMMPGDKAQNFGETMKQLIGYLRGFRFKLVVVIVFAIISTVFTIIAPAIMGQATDIIVTGVMGDGIDYTRLYHILVFLAVLYLISALFSYLQGYIVTGVAQGVTYKLRKDISEKIDTLPLSYFDTKTHGEIQSRVTNDVDLINNTLGSSMINLITAIATVLGVLVMMISINLLMTIVALIVIPLSIILIRVIVSFSQKHFSAQQNYLGDINGHIEEMYTGHNIVKAFNGEPESKEEFDEINEKLYSSSWKAQFLSGLMMPIMTFIGNLSYVFVCIVGGFLAVQGVVTIGSIQAFMQYVRNLNQPLMQMANVVNILQSTAAAAERVFDFLAAEDEIADTLDPEFLDIDSVEAHIEFDHVQFGYSPDKILIHDFSVNVKPGQTVAIVGPTGAGKTTMVKLLMRFYDLNSGRILIDDVDISNYTRQDLRSLFGMVLQDTWLFNGTIMDNIRYGNEGATEEEAYEAAKVAQIDHFIHTLPGGYDLVINEDASNISQGQKQLLTIARAFLADAPILILDEATSSVDTRTEVLIQKAMTNLMKGRTSFVIAHRLSTIKHADLILFMQDGDIVEKGTHEELMAKGGAYAELYNSQFEVQ